MEDMDVFDDLAAEDERLDLILAALDDDAWRSPSGAAGWSVTDVVLHLAQTDEAVAASAGAPTAEAGWPADASGVDDAADRMVREQRAEPAEVFARWRAAQQASLSALRDAEPGTRLLWVAGSLKPATLATTRLAEHWAHGLDITGPLGIDFPDTDRLRHIAWLGHSTLPYAFSLEGEEAHPVYCRLTGPDGDMWTFGSDDAESSIVGLAGSFCRVGAHRVAPEDAALIASGPYGPTALRILRNYAA
jgi:uncharacterized protein (TIGR03084 family)